MPTALFYDPYLDTLGGGERYTLTAAKVLSEHGFDVFLAWKDQRTLDAASQRFHLDLSKIFLSSEYYRLFQHGSIPARFQALSPLDVVFYVSDGSVPVLFGKHTLLHYQVPFTHTNRHPFIDRLKLTTIRSIVVNSRFTKSVIDETLGINHSTVLYPPIAVEEFSPGEKKDNLILNVGRFASPLHSKRQDILIQAFRGLYEQGTTNWRLVLAGGHQGPSKELDHLKHLAKGLPVEFAVNTDYASLKKLYQSGSIYWHAAGFDVDEVLNPESTEHFGITTVEAMASGCVPVVVPKGGQKEIVISKVGFHANTIPEFITVTSHLIARPKLLKQLSSQAVIRSRLYSQDKFASGLLSLC